MNCATYRTACFFVSYLQEKYVYSQVSRSRHKTREETCCRKNRVFNLQKLAQNRDRTKPSLCFGHCTWKKTTKLRAASSGFSKKTYLYFIQQTYFSYLLFVLFFPIPKKYEYTKKTRLQKRDAGCLGYNTILNS